jgi:2-deoxy-D-gluconate 3-dehydrogenase
VTASFVAAVPPWASLEGRTALVTGARTGIGRAVALAMARAGADVVLWGRSPAGLDEVAAQVEGLGRKARTVVADLHDPRATLAAADDVLAATTVDILVNNAGIIRRADAETTTLADWRDVLSINLDAVFLLCQRFGSAMLERGDGAIVMIASLLSFQGGIKVPAYSASKHAVAGLTRSLANEWAGRGVNVNAVAPGYITTANTEALREDPEREAEISARIPAGRWGLPEDVAGAVTFLASPAARYVHGHVLAVDGGWLAR